MRGIFFLQRGVSRGVNKNTQVSYIQELVCSIRGFSEHKMNHSENCSIEIIFEFMAFQVKPLFQNEINCEWQGKDSSGIERQNALSVKIQNWNFEFCSFEKVIVPVQKSASIFAIRVAITLFLEKKE